MAKNLLTCLPTVCRVKADSVLYASAYDCGASETVADVTACGDA